jgi:hypothetical protein
MEPINLGNFEEIAYARTICFDHFSKIFGTFIFHSIFSNVKFSKIVIVDKKINAIGIQGMITHPINCCCSISELRSKHQ